MKSQIEGSSSFVCQLDEGCRGPVCAGHASQPALVEPAASFRVVRSGVGVLRQAEGLGLLNSSSSRGPEAFFPL